MGQDGREGRGSFCCLSISAVLIGGVGVDHVSVRLLAVFARWHPLVYPVQAASLLEVTDLPRGREALNSWWAEETGEEILSVAENAVLSFHYPFLCK